MYQLRVALVDHYQLPDEKGKCFFLTLIEFVHFLDYFWILYPL